MEPPISSWVFRFILTLFIFFQPSSSSSSSSSSLSSLHPLIINSTIEFKNYTAISEFRVLNRRVLDQCPDPNPYLQINVSSNSDLSDEEYVTVTVSGVLVPSNSDWVAMISPSNSDVTFYSGQNEMELKVGEAELPWGKRVVLNRSNTVFIDNLPQGIRKAWLFNLFSRFGKIQNIYVPNKKSQKTGNKFGFVRYCNPFYAQKAVEAINGSWIWGEILVANIARFERKNKSKSMQDGNYNIKGKSVEDGQDMSSNGKEQNLSGIWRHKNSPKRSSAQNRLRKGIYVWRKKEIMDQKLGNFSIPVQVKEQGNGWLYRSATAKMDSTRSIVRIQDQLRNLGHAHIQVRHMGGNMVVLTFKDQEERDTMFNKGKMGWLKEWFVESTKGENTKSNPCTRLVWLNCYGVPLHLWNYQNFLEIGRIWGEAIMVADETIKNLSFAVGKILISTSTMESINKTVELDNNGNLVQIRVIEEQFVVNTFLRTDCSCPGCQVEASSMQTLEDSNVQPSTQEENGGEVQPLEDSNVQPSTQEESEGEVKSKGHQIEEAIDSSSPLVEPAPSILGSYPGAIAAPLCPVNITSKQLVPFIESNSSHQITRGSREAESSIPCLKDPASSYLEALTRNLKLPKQNISPLKAQYVSNDPDYLSCKKKECKKYDNGECVVATCSGSLSFHIINIRTDIEFVFFARGFEMPCILRRSIPLKFSNPKKPLYGHLSSVDSTGTSMRVTWVSGDKEPQQVQYGNGKSQTSQVTTFSQDNMCSTSILPSPAIDFGWHDPGYIHSAVMNALKPSSTFSYRYGSNSVGWSDKIQFKTPAAGGSEEVKFLAFGDMGKAPRDASVEHYIQPGSLSVMKAMGDEVASGDVDSIFHIGDISYATGFLVEWDFFLHLISPVASQVSYMTAIGNHERDYADSGSVYITPDSGGECGVPYETYFPMPVPAKDKPWYSIEQGPVHFTVISTEHDWSQNSEQYNWMNKDMASVDRSRTPWIVFSGHRPMYSTSNGISIIPSVDDQFVQAVEPLLLANKVDLALFGHVHNYERTCAVYQSQCKAMPKKDQNGIDTYDNSNYSAPVHAVIGMAGFSLDTFPSSADSWSLSRISKYGYVRVHATKQDLTFEYVNANSRKVEDSFRITRS